MTQFKRKKSGFPTDTPIWVLQISLVGCLLLWVGLLFAPFGSHDAALDRNEQQKVVVQQTLAKNSLLRNQFQQQKKVAPPVVVQPVVPAVVAAASSDKEGDDTTGEAETDDSEPKKQEEEGAVAAADDDDKADANEDNEEADAEADGEAEDEEDGDNEADEEDGDEEGAGAADESADAGEDAEDADGSPDVSADADGGDAEDADEADGGGDAEEADAEEEEAERRRLDDGEVELDSKRFILEISGLMGETATGKVIIETRPAWAPIGAGHFHLLIENGYYNQCRFFRVVPNFIVQFGIAASPDMTQKYGSDILLDDPVKKSNDRGTVTYATAGPNTRTTQLFVNTQSNSFLDDQGFAPFAEVVQGMEFIDQINNEYGESPDQGRIEHEGNEYLNAEYPNLSYIVEIYEDGGTRRN